VSQLADIIEARRDEVVQRWSDHLFATGVPESIRREDVIDTMRPFLDELIEGLRREHGFQQHLHTTGSSAVSKGHGRQRFNLGYDLGAVIREYGTLRDVIFQVIEEARGTPSIRELRILSKYLINGIADAASQYGLEQDAEVRRQAARHISFLAHELRNPLGSLRLTVDIMLRKGELKSGRTTQRLEQGLERLSHLIDSSLVEMRMRSVPEPQREAMSLESLLQKLAAEVAEELEAKDLQLSIDVAPGLTMQADPKLLHSALSNLVRNAVKFTHQGGNLQLRAKAGGKRVTVQVEDECGGLPEGRLQTLFNPFMQIGQDRSGFGLGLAIAKQAVEAHKGELRVHNLPGRGCVFVLDMPTHLAEPSSEDSAA
jgi:signal transduction histidine kinase